MHTSNTTQPRSIHSTTPAVCKPVLFNPPFHFGSVGFAPAGTMRSAAGCTSHPVDKDTGTHVRASSCRGAGFKQKKKRYREGKDDPGKMRLKCGEHGNFESSERV